MGSRRVEQPTAGAVLSTSDEPDDQVVARNASFARYVLPEVDVQLRVARI